MKHHITYLIFNIGLWLIYPTCAANSKTIILNLNIRNQQTNQAVTQAHIIYHGRVITTTDSVGNFHIQCQINDTITISHMAFDSKTLIITPQLPKTITVLLQPAIHQTQEVIVTAKTLKLTQRSNTGIHQISSKEILKTPEFLGEPDVLRTLQLLPGIQSVNEGNSGIYVRGGSAGQNFVLFDHIELLNPSHVMGIFSVFNPLLTQKVDLYKGTAPVHLSSRQSSTIIVETHSAPTVDSWEGNIGTISSNLTFNKASKNNKWFFQAGARRSFLELYKEVASLFITDNNNYFTTNNYRFYDLNGKIAYRDDKNQLTLSWYKGGDRFDIDRNNLTANLDWGNEGAAIHWWHPLSQKTSLATTINYSGYASSFEALMPNGNIDLSSKYQHIKTAIDLTTSFKKHLVKYGLQTTHYTILPQHLNLSLSENSIDADYRYRSFDTKLYLSDTYQISDKWMVYAGASLNYYNLYNIKQENSSAQPNSPTTNNITINPHIDLIYKPTLDAAIKSSYSYTTQNLHYATIASIPIPSDIWMPATEQLPLEYGDQITLGYFRQIPTINGEVGIDLYGKRMNNQLILNVNTEDEAIDSFDENFSRGKGIAYGAELIFRGELQKLEAQLSYTLGWVKHQFDDINEGQWFDATYDRRHDLSITLSYPLTSRIEFSSVFMFATGNKATLAPGFYWLKENIADDYSGVNNYRMSSYQRLDIAMSYTLKSTRFSESKLNFSIINVYNRSNPFFIYYKVDESKDNKYSLSIKGKQVSLFPLMPSVSWRFKF